MGFSRQEYWSGFPFPSPEDLPDPGIEPRSSALHAASLPPESPGKPFAAYRTLIPLTGIEPTDFPGGSDGKESTCNVGDPGSVPGLGRSPGEGNGYPLQYSCLGDYWTEEPCGLQSMESERVRHD